MLPQASGMPTSEFSRRVILPVSIVIVGAIALVLGFVIVSAIKQDAIAISDSKRLAQTALQVKERELGRNLKDYAIWEDAYKNLYVDMNVDWASTDGNVGANILNSLGYEMAFVVNSARHTVYSVLDGNPTKADAYALFPSGLDPMIQKASTQAEPVVGLLRSGDDIDMVGINSILPPTGTAEAPAPDKRSVLIFAKRLNSSYLDRISQDYLLRDLILTKGPSTSSASLPLFAPDGAQLGSISWTADKPGQQLLNFLLPPLVFAMVALVLFAMLVLRNARRSAKAIEESTHTIKAYAQTLESSEARFRDVAEASSDWIWETDPECRLTFLSTRFSDVTGVSAASVLGRSLDQFFSSDAESDGWTQLRGDTEARSTFRDVRCCYRDADGSRRICRIAGRPILNSSGAFSGYRGTATDITPEVEAHARANHLALHDVLTQLPNRVLLQERLTLALSQAESDGSSIAVLCLDLDHFKEVNDTLGHGAGDALLREVAERLRASVRSSDTVARLGGDEFAIIQAGSEQPQDSDALCRRILEAIKAPFRIDGNDIFVGVSIGVTVSPSDGLDHERLLKNADIALYRAKHAGRATFRMFEAKMDAELQARKSLEQDLRQALARGELVVHYQPLVTVQGQQLTAVEALLRWEHPQRGLISPAEFIPVAEETGFIVAIGEWVLRTACTQVQAWPGMHVAVNLSPVQFKHHELVQTIRDVLTDTKLDPARLELEITESVLLNDTKAALEILTELKTLGVRIAMDDFGTGYSSLGYLNSFPFDKIKIDRSFISDLGQTEKSNAIVKSVLSLGHSLEMVTTAEGVETLAQLQFLRDEGCKQIQGYYFGKAMPAAQLTEVRRNWSHTFRKASAA